MNVQEESRSLKKEIDNIFSGQILKDIVHMSN